MKHVFKALRLIDDMEHAGEYYKRACICCIKGVDGALANLDDAALRNAVEEKVICPLEEEVKFYYAKSKIEDCL